MISVQTTYRVLTGSKYSFIVFLYCLLAYPFSNPVLSKALDVARSGNYVIRNCNAGESGSMAEQLQTLLPQIYDNLQGVIADAALGTNSQHGFSALFKKNDSIDFVQGIFKAMAAGKPVPIHTEGRTTNPLLNLGWPTIVCVDPEEQPNIARGCATELVPAGNDGQYVMLCPLFWEIEKEAASWDCPRVRRNTLTPNDDTLAVNQQAALVHELAHMYGVTLPNKDDESYRIGDAVDLDEENSLQNAANFAYFYAGKKAQTVKETILGLYEAFSCAVSSASKICYS